MDIIAELTTHLTKLNVPFCLSPNGIDVTFPISKYFFTAEEGKLYFVDENDNGVPVDAAFERDVTAALKLHKLEAYNGFFIVRKSKDSVHGHDGKTLLKCKSLKKLKEKVDELTASVVEEPIVEEPMSVSEMVIPEEPILPKRKVPKRKVPKRKAPTDGEVTPVKKRALSNNGKSIKTIVLEMITDDAEDADIIAAIKGNFPESKFDANHVSWYRSTWYRDGIIEPKHAPRRSKVYKAWLKDSQPESTRA